MANEQTMNDQMRVRREKMQELRDAGIDPFGHRFERDSMNQELHEKYGDMDKEELNDKDIIVTIAGRMVAKRGKGKVGFADLQDKTGRMQLYIRKHYQENLSLNALKSEKTCTTSLSVLISVISWELQVRSSRLTWAN